jgi:hypothetical protein
MRGVCDTCDQISELFQLEGRTDMNCHECHRSIEGAIELYRALRKLEAAGYDVSELSVQLKQIVTRLLDRVRIASQNLALPQARYLN